MQMKAWNVQSTWKEVHPRVSVVEKEAHGRKTSRIEGLEVFEDLTFISYLKDMYRRI